MVAQLRDLLEKRLDYEGRDGESFIEAAQNARLVRSAERYYRIMYYGGAKSWNLRDSHMFETLEHLLEAGGPEAKAVVWAHNFLIGDARATEMGAVWGEHNIGQLSRGWIGDEAALIGMGTRTGTVAAARDWDGEMEVKPVRPSREDSYERLCHEAGERRSSARLRHRRAAAAMSGGGAPRALHRRESICLPRSRSRSSAGRCSGPKRLP